MEETGETEETGEKRGVGEIPTPILREIQEIQTTKKNI
jgi:hypothetical protein